MDLIYHGSITKNIDGTKKLIVAGEKRLVSIDRCFLKNPQDVKKCQMKSRSCTKKESTVSRKDYDTYMRQRQWIDCLVLVIEQKDN